MPNKNFVIIIPDSNGDRSSLVVKLGAESHVELDEYTVRKHCDRAIENYLVSVNPAEREGMVIDELKCQGYTVEVLLTSYTTIETRE
jgi:hypothetical protein